MSLLASLFSRPFSRGDDRAALRPLYAALIETAREPHWYLDGAVPDTIDGRFDMVAAVLSLALIRMEALGLQGEGARLTEIFVEDMDGQVRQIGFGDLVVGKQIGKMMSALGGRLAAYRAGLTGEASLDEAVVRNIFRGEAPDPAALAHVSAGLRAFAAALDTTGADALLAGALPD
jgi:cytochrome b pre-mRNA-processing protein 3